MRSFKLKKHAGCKSRPIDRVLTSGRVIENKKDEIAKIIIKDYELYAVTESGKIMTGRDSNAWMRT